MTPCVSPGAVIQRVAYLITGDGLAAVGGQQVAPGGIAVGVVGYFSWTKSIVPDAYFALKTGLFMRNNIPNLVPFYISFLPFTGGQMNPLR